MGGGNYYFIEDPQSIPSIFQRELNELFQISARAVEIIIQLPENVQVQVLGGWRNTKDEKGFHIFLGDLASEQHKEIYLRLLTPTQGTQETIEITARIFARDETDGVLEVQESTVLQYVDKAQAEAAEEDAGLMRRFTIVDNAEVANEALKLERAGHFAQASAMLHQKTVLNSSRMAQDEINEYEGLSHRMNQGLKESDRKQSNYDANIRRKMREH
jgi:Ca-activated chloride channel homolog